MAVKSGLSADMLSRKGRLANVVKALDRFIREAVLEQAILLRRWRNFLLAIRLT